MPIYTIGHGNQSLEEFLVLLDRYKIRCLIDVRSKPYSNYARQFDREDFSLQLNNRDIKYEYKGNALGGKPSNNELLTGGQPDYHKIRESAAYSNELKKMVGSFEKDQVNIVLLCSEENPLRCHRFLLIAENIYQTGEEIYHIRQSGAVQKHSEIRGGNQGQQPSLNL